MSPTPSSRGTNGARQRLVRAAFWIALGVAATLVAATLARLAATPFGVWARSTFFGTAVRWQDAYAAFESPEALLPRDPGQRERLLLALAEAEDAPPRGLPTGPRLHPPGTLAHLRYEAFDASGARIDAWSVRALVPPLPSFAPGSGPHAATGCPDACRRELVRRGGVLLVGSGDPGLATEWVLRMPLAQPLDLGARPLVTQDLFASTPHRVSIETRRVDGREVLRPANVRVTLIEACPGEVRVGEIVHPRADAGALVPIPRGFETERWVQLEGCEALANAAPQNEHEPAASPPAAGAAPPPEPTRLDPSDRGVLVARRDAGTGVASIWVDAPWLERHGRPVVVALREICRYDPAGGAWMRVADVRPRAPIHLDPRRSGVSPEVGRPFVELPAEVALFSFRWSETDVADAAPGSTQPRSGAANVIWREATVVSGPILCNDVDLGAVPPGAIAACVPFPNHAEARIVPRPACGE